MCSQAITTVNLTEIMANSIIFHHGFLLEIYTNKYVKQWTRLILLLNVTPIPKLHLMVHLIVFEEDHPVS